MHFLTPIVAPRKARLALIADDAGLNSDAVTDFECADGRVFGNDHTRRFVAEDMSIADDHWPDTPRAPEMDV